MGFARRRDSREDFTEIRFSPRPRSERIRQFHFKASVSNIANQRDVLETRQRIGEFSTAFESGDAVTFRFLDRFEFIEEPFDLRSNVTLAPGGYRFDTYEFRLDTFRRRHARVNLRFATGGFWSGERDTLSLRTNYRLSTNLGLSWNYEVNWVDLPEGKFTTHLVSSRVQLAFRNDVVLLSLFQYNHDTRRLSSNIRFNWIPKPGTDFFIVYNELDEWSGLQAQNRSLTVKLNYLFAF